MTDILANLSIGFSVALTGANLLYCFIGVTLGTLIGVLPGIGPPMTVAMLLPVTFGLAPVTALIMLAGIYYGAQYGGSTTAILINIPGESSSVVTTLDGYAMARQGRAGVALAIAAIGSFFAGTVSTLVIASLGPPLAELALRFGPAEYFALMALGLVSAAVLARGSLVKAISMILLGLLLGLVGTDVNSGIQRYTFGIPELADGIDFVLLAMGMFGLAEVMVNLEEHGLRSVIPTKISSLMPNMRDLKASAGAIVRGTLMGSLLGILPGGGALISSFASYALEKRISRDPTEFGRGAIQGVAGPEAANNAGAQTSFIPMLTMGIPSNAVMALMLAAMVLHSITPGPQVMTERPDLFWGLIASMWIGNLFLVVLNLPLVGIWVRLLAVPYRYLYPSILLFISIGSYSLNNKVVDVLLTAAFGIMGYILVKLDFEVAPLALGFILGPMMEESLRRAMLISRGDATVFLRRPISLSLLVAAAVLLLTVIAPSVRRTKEKVFKEET